MYLFSWCHELLCSACYLIILLECRSYKQRTGGPPGYILMPMGPVQQLQMTWATSTYRTTVHTKLFFCLSWPNLLPWSAALKPTRTFSTSLSWSMQRCHRQKRHQGATGWLGRVRVRFMSQFLLSRSSAPLGGVIAAQKPQQPVCSLSERHHFNLRAGESD